MGREAVTLSGAHSPSGVRAPSTQQPAEQAGKPVFLSRACRELHRSGSGVLRSQIAGFPGLRWHSFRFFSDADIGGGAIAGFGPRHAGFRASRRR